LSPTKTWLEDFCQQGQIQFQKGRVERGGVEYAMCHLHSHWSYNNMVAALFFLACIQIKEDHLVQQPT